MENMNHILENAKNVLAIDNNIRVAAVSGYRGIFAIASDGRAISLKRKLASGVWDTKPRFLSARTLATGLVQYVLRLDGVSKYATAASLVAGAFIDGYKTGDHIEYIDKDKRNCDISNLKSTGASVLMSSHMADAIDERHIVAARLALGIPDNVKVAQIACSTDNLITSDGRAVRIKTSRDGLTEYVWNKQYDNGRGHLGIYVGSPATSSNINVKVHREVAKAFISNPNKLDIVDHIDGNKTNNNAYNLDWVTLSTNTKRAITKKLITIRKGEESNRAGFTNEQVREIIRRAFKGESGASIARSFKMDKSTINKILSKKNWSQIWEEPEFIGKFIKRQATALTVEAVEQICRMFMDGKQDDAIAEIFNTKKDNISNIRARNTFKHVTESDGFKDMIFPEDINARLSVETIRDIKDLISRDWPNAKILKHYKEHGNAKVTKSIVKNLRRGAYADI